MKKIIVSLIVIITTLMSCQSSKSTTDTVSPLEGTWELNYISGPKITFKGLYPEQVPNIAFLVKENRFYGSNSCNRYSGILKVDKNKINFKDVKIAMTMMACPGQGESVFMSTLEKIDFYAVSDDGKTLNFMIGDVAMMRFEKVVSKHN